MLIQRTAALATATAILLAVPCLAQEAAGEDNTVADEVVVVGHGVAATSSTAVDAELVVDTSAALKTIPGANVNRNGPLAGIAQYRGMYGDRVAVDIDQLGVVSGGPNAMDTPLSYMSPMITRPIEVTRGIASVSLAPESIGGYIATEVSRGDFSTGDSEISGFLGTHYSDNGDVKTSAARLTFATPVHRISLVGQLDNGDDLRSPEGRLRPTGLDRQRYDLSYGYAGASGRFMVNAGGLNTRDTGTPALPMDIIVIDTNLSGGNFVYDVSSKLAVDGRFSRNHVDHQMDNFSFRETMSPAMYRLNTTAADGSQFALAATVDLRDSRLRTGIDGVAAEHDSLITNPNNPMFAVQNFRQIERNLLGLFTEWTRSQDSGDLELGLRFNKVTTAAGTVSASGMMGTMGQRVDELAAAFNAADRELKWSTLDAVLKYRRSLGAAVDWNIDLGVKSRAPSYQELYLWLPLEATGGLADGRNYIGNLDLRAERSREVSTGLSMAAGRFSMSPQIYFKSIRNYIQGVPSANTVANMVSTMMTGAAALQYDNVDARIWGADAAWRYEFTDHLRVDGALSLTRGRRQDIDDNLYRLAPYNGSIAVQYRGEAWNFRSELVGYANQDKVSAYNGEADTAGYWLVNLALDWRAGRALLISARIDNLLDESYQDHLAGVNRASGSDIAVGERLFGIGRTFTAGLRYDF